MSGSSCGVMEDWVSWEGRRHRRGGKCECWSKHRSLLVPSLDQKRQSGCLRALSKERRYGIALAQDSVFIDSMM